MPDQPTLPEILEGTLDHRAESLGEIVPTGLDGVARRVERRRARRRTVAVGGSVAIIAAGAAGLLLVERGDDAPAPGSAAPSAAPPATELVDVGGRWRCQGLVGADGEYTYFDECEEVPDGAEVTLIPDQLSGAVATTAPVPAEQTYTVVAGDSIFEIAEQYGVEMDALANYNRWDDGIDHVLDVGEVVRIPPVVAAAPTTSG
jgi:LysM repeat protein